MRKLFFSISVFLFLLLFLSCGSVEEPFSFAVASDMREYTGDDPSLFRGACKALVSVGPGSFMISCGDIDPPEQVLETLTTYIGSDYLWYPVVGNHEAETPSDMEWLRNYYTDTLASRPELAGRGPEGSEETMYSFDYGPIHFVILNEYFDGLSDTGTDGDISDPVYSWLEEDLIETDRDIILVFGHEPAYPLADEESGRLRHEGDSLDLYEVNRDRFWDLLINHGVTAYVCGHTHNYSSELINGVWQIDSGHSRGFQDMGAKSTFLKFIYTINNDLTLETYRMDLETGFYSVYETVGF